MKLFATKQHCLLDLSPTLTTSFFVCKEDAVDLYQYIIVSPADQLRFLQSNQVEKVPQFKPMDDVEKLNRVLQKTDIAESKSGVGSAVPDVEEVPSDPRQCCHRTHRCHHAAHAYTGIPCAAYRK